MSLVERSALRLPMLPGAPEAAAPAPLATSGHQAPGLQLGSKVADDEPIGNQSGKEQKHSQVKSWGVGSRSADKNSGEQRCEHTGDVSPEIFNAGP